MASLLKGKNAVIQEVAEEMERRDPSASKTRLAPILWACDLEVEVKSPGGPPSSPRTDC
jgi:hypothetical protein